MNFQEALTSVYLQYPCQVLPNALWKTLARLDKYRTSFHQKDGAITRLQIWGNNELILLWDADRTTQTQISPQKWDSLNFAHLHNSYSSQIPVGRFSTQKSFRLINRSQIFPEHALGPGFVFVKVDIQTEAAKVADFIDACYQDISPTNDTVRGWTRHPTYDPDLWIWVIDTDRNTPAALGIAEFDATIQEGSLEWIQVHPGYRLKGVGKAMVIKLLQGLHGKAKFTTVACQVDNLMRPDLLYKRSGFTGDDIWHILRLEQKSRDP